MGVVWIWAVLETRPQQYVLPATVSPHVSASPALMDWKARPPLTAVGATRFTVVPSPSWPFWLSPQQKTDPSTVRPHEGPLPLVTAETVCDDE